MATASRQIGHASGVSAPVGSAIMLVSNPNAGKTTLFNQITGLRHKTSNYPGTTLDLRSGSVRIGDTMRELYDMPGLYTLQAGSAEERVAVDALAGRAKGLEAPAAILLVIDSTNLVRNLYLASQVLGLGVPVVVALNMMDLAEHAGTRIDVETLEAHLGCPVVPVVARKGTGVDRLLRACGEVIAKGERPELPRLLLNTAPITDDLRYRWAETVGTSVLIETKPARGVRTAKLDAYLLHPVGGFVTFFAVLFGMFYLIFSLASLPMDLIDGAFGSLSAWAGHQLPEGPLQSLISGGVIPGVGGVLVFLPQICTLFFCISILEDTGYLARAACVVDRVLRRVGLPGKAFVPMLSAHACAIPAIMASRVIEDRKDRLVTILILPLMTCSARLPVYAMVTALLFPASPLKGAALFTAAYALGLFAALSMAFLFRRTLVKSTPAPLMIELPSYKVPSVNTALFAAYDRARLFVRKAGTVILAISIVLWWMMSYPTIAAPDLTPAQSESLAQQGLTPENWSAQQQLVQSFAGRLGHVLEPIIAPLGFDWRIGVGIVASFAAREVVVSALSIIYGVGADGAKGGSLLIDHLHAAVRPDGTPVFGFATCASLLVFYILAMQCMPTLAVTRRETGGWKWAAFQFGYMTCLAYTAAFITYQSLRAFGIH